MELGFLYTRRSFGERIACRLTSIFIFSTGDVDSWLQLNLGHSRKPRSEFFTQSMPGKDEHKVKLSPVLQIISP